MNPDSPEHFRSILATKTREQIANLPDEVCQLISYAFGGDPNVSAGTMRSFLHSRNLERNSPQ